MGDAVAVGARGLLAFPATSTGVDCGPRLTQYHGWFGAPYQESGGRRACQSVTRW